MAQTRPDHFVITQNKAFVDKEFKLKLTPESKTLFDSGCPGQGYIGLVDVETGNIYLVPSFNKDDGLLRVNKEGKEFVIEKDNKKVNLSMASQFELGRMGTGDLHRNCSALLGLAHKGAQNAKLMGFGIWKGGRGLKIVPDMPQETALVPNEILIFKKEGQWKLIYIDERYAYGGEQVFNNRREILNHREHTFSLFRKEISINSFPELLELLESKDVNTVETRNAIAAVLADYRFGLDDQPSIKFIKNRSTQNTFSCEYSKLYRAYFQIMTSSHGAHQLGLPREIPLEAFEKITRAVHDGLELKFDDSVKFVEQEALSADTLNGIAFHLELERQWQHERDKCLKDMCLVVLNDSQMKTDKDLLIHFLKLADQETVAKMRSHIKFFMFRNIFSNLKLGKNAFDCLVATMNSPEELKTQLADLDHYADLNYYNESEKQFLQTLLAIWIKKPPNYNVLDSTGDTLLFFSLQNNSYSCSSLVLEAGADPNCPNGTGELPIIYAAQSKNWEMLSLLLEYKANPNVRDINGSPLEFAWQDKNVSAIAKLVQYGAHPFDEKSELKPDAVFQFLLNENRNLAIVNLFKKSNPDIQEKIINSLLQLLNSPNKEKIMGQIFIILYQIDTYKPTNFIGEQLAKIMLETPNMIDILLNTEAELLSQLFAYAESNIKIGHAMTILLLKEVGNQLGIEMMEGTGSQTALVHFVASQKNAELSKAWVSALTKQYKYGKGIDLYSDNRELLLAVLQACKMDEIIKTAIVNWINETPDVRRRIQSDIELNSLHCAISENTPTVSGESFLKKPSTVDSTAPNISVTKELKEKKSGM